MKELILHFKSNLISAAKNSPIEIIISICFLILNITTYYIDNTFLDRYIGYYFSSFAFVFALNIIFKSKRIYYYLSLLFPICIYIYLQTIGSFKDEYVLVITTLSSIALIFTAYNEKENTRFTLRAINTISNVAVCVLLTAISYLILESIITSVNYIFDIKISGIIKEFVVKYCPLYVILPAIFLVLGNKNDDKVNINKYIEVLINYILTPALLIYGVILYCYFAKVIIKWELPEGIISITAIVFLSVGVLVKATRDLTTKKIAEWFFKYIGYISIPALIMLWVGSSYRIWQYGFTEARVYLMTTVVVLTVWNFSQMIKKSNVYQFLCIFTLIAFNVAAHIKVTPIDKNSEKNGENSEQFYVHTKNVKGIDISGFSKLYDINQSNNYHIKNDTLHINLKEDSISLKISTNEILDSILNKAGCTISELGSDDAYKKIEPNCGSFKNDSLIIIFFSMNFKKTEDKATLYSASIDQVILK